MLYIVLKYSVILVYSFRIQGYINIVISMCCKVFNECYYLEKSK